MKNTKDKTLGISKMGGGIAESHQLFRIYFPVLYRIFRSDSTRYSNFHSTFFLVENLPFPWATHTYIEYKLVDPVLFYSYKWKYITILLIGSSPTLLTGHSLPYHSFNASIYFFPSTRCKQYCFIVQKYTNSIICS